MIVMSSFIAMEHKKEDKSLEALWTEYRKASEQDRVQKMAAVLEEIKAEAIDRKASWDYYQACNDYVEVKSRRDWKLRDSLRQQMRTELSAYGEPLLIYLMDRERLPYEDLMKSVAEMKDRLVAEHTVDVYMGRGLVLNPAVCPLVDDDYEYVLWDMFRLSVHGHYSFSQKGEIYRLLQGEISDSYPKAGIAEFLYVNSLSLEEEKENRLKALADRYEGQALSLLPVQALMDIEFSKNRQTGSSGYFMDFRRRLESYENERKSYRSGIERLVVEDCHGFERLLKHLETKSVLATVVNGKAELALRNLEQVKVRVTRGDVKVYETVLENPEGSFYKLDTLDFELPSLDDGDYRIRCFDGKEEIGQCRYPKYTLSVACRTDNAGTGIYVADYLSGEPVGKVDMALYKGDRKVVEAFGIEMNGFTYLPQELASRLGKGSSGCYLVCSCAGDDGKVRRSQDMYIYAEKDFDTSVPAATYASVMLDRAAFNPEETVKFKAVVYESLPDGSMNVTAGYDVSVRLSDSQGNILSENDMRTNEYGSVAGEFVLDGIRRNGLHQISIWSAGRHLGSAALTVDEFVLPAFEVSFDEQEKAFLPGEGIVVKGKITSYSGHPVASAGVSAEVKLKGRIVKDVQLEISQDGVFSLEFQDESAEEDAYSPYEIEIKVVDVTGETKAFSCRRYVMRHPSLNIGLENPAEGSFRLAGGNRIAGWLLDDDVARVTFGVSYAGGDTESLPLKYSVMKGEDVVAEGEALSGIVQNLDFSGLPSGLYEIVAEVVLTDARGERLEGKSEAVILKVRDDDKCIEGDMENVFRVLSDDAPVLQIGAGSGAVWAVVELFGDNGRRLKAGMVRLEKGEMKTIRYDYEPYYPDDLIMNVLYFRDSQCYTYSRTWKRQVKVAEIPLEFVRFEDMSSPGASCSVMLKTSPETEVLASVFDVSTEQVRKNQWRRISGRYIPVSSVNMRTMTGMDGSGYSAMMGDPFDIYDSGFMSDGDVLEETMVVGYGAARRKSVMTAHTMNAAESVSEEPVEVRDDFAASLAFRPFLYPSEEGLVNFDFNTSDKVSTFVVSVFVHDKSMNNNVLRREMLVTLPVKVSVVQPQYLHEGDSCVLKASVSNNSESDVSGMVVLEGSAEGVCEVMVPAGASVPVLFDVSVPSGVEEMQFKIVFKGDGCSDGVLVRVPVYPSSQELVEAHSAVLLHGMSEECVLRSLEGRFVNVTPMGAEYSSISVMDMLRDALPLTAEAKGKDVISQSEAMYVNLLAASLRACEGEDVRSYVEAAMASVSRILACANLDGGFGWFEGMKSSPVVTAVVLERFAGLRDRKLLGIVSDEMGEDALDELDEAVISAVRYIDSVYFGDPDRPSWYGSLSLQQYMNVRSSYAGVPFDENAARKSMGTKRYKEFREAARAYLIPKDGERWTEGAVLAKVRLVRIIKTLENSEQGRALADAWGVPSGRKLRRSMISELGSLKEYAVPHPSGGIYYPNAVLPYRGLLESEAYAHAMICDIYEELASDEGIGEGLDMLADGIRLWLMLQKETQQWDSDPGFVEALASVYDGSPALKDTRVIVLSKRYSKPFNDIRPAGNGFKVSVGYFVEDGSAGEELSLKPLSEGDVLHAGDRVVAKYSVWSEENRSFVRLSVPRPACLRPENQLSGWSGGWFRPLSYGPYDVSPYAYREVKADRTLYWIDVCPEEDTSIEETFFVTQEGRFTSPVAEIESLYAPHYRANDGFAGYFFSEWRQ